MNNATYNLGNILAGVLLSLLSALAGYSTGYAYAYIAFGDAAEYAHAQAAAKADVSQWTNEAMNVALDTMAHELDHSPYAPSFTWNNLDPKQVIDDYSAFRVANGSVKKIGILTENLPARKDGPTRIWFVNMDKH